VRIPPTYVDSFASFRASIRKGDVTVPKVPMEEPLAIRCAHFLECIETGSNHSPVQARGSLWYARSRQFSVRSVQAVAKSKWNRHADPSAPY
jgi:hypothetical protein